MEDKELIRRIQDGSKEYLNEIAEKYYDDIYYFCCYQTGSREEAYDLAQETFLRFVRYVERYRYRNLKGYLLTIAMNLCRDYMREKMLRRTEADPGAAAFDIPESERDSSGIKRMEDSMLLLDAYGYKTREIARMPVLGMLLSMVGEESKTGIMMSLVYMLVPFLWSDACYLHMLGFFRKGASGFRSLVLGLICGMTACFPLMWEDVYAAEYRPIWYLLGAAGTVLIALEIRCILEKIEGGDSICLN